MVGSSQRDEELIFYLEYVIFKNLDVGPWREGKSVKNVDVFFRQTV